MVARPPFSERQPRSIGVAAAVAFAHLLLGYLLLTGLAVRMPSRIAESLTVITLRPEPRPRPAPASASPVKRTAQASPRNLKAAPDAVVAPKVVVPPQHTPIVAATVPGIGTAASAGASDLPGAGTGDGGVDAGGGRGGEGGEPWQPSKRVAGKIKDSDYPPNAKAAGVGGTTHVHFTVGVDGRVSNCRIAESSGSRELDDLTCRLITERFRYRPARDRDGNLVTDEWFGENEWIPR